MKFEPANSLTTHTHTHSERTTPENRRSEKRSDKTKIRKEKNRTQHKLVVGAKQLGRRRHRVWPLDGLGRRERTISTRRANVCTSHRVNKSLGRRQSRHVSRRVLGRRLADCARDFFLFSSRPSLRCRFRSSLSLALYSAAELAPQSHHSSAIASCRHNRCCCQLTIDSLSLSRTLMSSCPCFLSSSHFCNDFTLVSRKTKS